MVFQNYALYPHMDVYDNIGFGLRMRHVPKAERRTRVEHAAAILGLRDHPKRKAEPAFGWARQRVAMGRAVVRPTEAFLMDEPLSNLTPDSVSSAAESRGSSGNWRDDNLRDPHDQVEAVTMADRVAVMRQRRAFSSSTDPQRDLRRTGRTCSSRPSSAVPAMSTSSRRTTSGKMTG